MSKILVATHNKGKSEEYKSYLDNLGFKIVGLDEEGINSAAEEVGNSYIEIAERKASFYSKYTNLPLIADDSGLEIYALGGFPGVNSNRWVKGSDSERNFALLNKMEKIKDRRAIFKTIIVYLHKKTFVRFAGELSGEISYKPSGVTGFGYDPIFYVPKMKRTLGELLLFEKNQISHRSQALQKLASYLKKYTL